MLRRFDRLVLRVDSLPAAVKFWCDVYGASVVREDRVAVALRLRDGGDVILHTDTGLPQQAMYLLVHDVRAMHALRSESKLDFVTNPAKGSRGYYATVRDPFGTVLHVADHCLDASDDAAEHAPEMPAGEQTLFGAAPTTHKPDRDRLSALYEELGRTADDLPYTTHFESLYDAYVAGYPDPKPGAQEVWRHLLTTRKAGQLPKLGAAKSAAPDLSDDDRGRLRKLLGTAIGRRDRLPYSTDFDDLVSLFNADRRRPFSPHQVWRAVASLSK